MKLTVVFLEDHASRSVLGEDGALLATIGEVKFHSPSFLTLSEKKGSFWTYRSFTAKEELPPLEFELDDEVLSKAFGPTGGNWYIMDPKDYMIGPTSELHELVMGQLWTR